MPSSWTPRWLLVSALAATVPLACKADPRSVERWAGSVPAPDISGLEVRSGAPFSLAAERGKVVVLSFGYTSCLEICPDTFAKAKQLYRELGSAAAELVFAYVTVDPDRDRPEAFHAFMSAVDPRFDGVYLDGDALRPVLASYGVTVRKRIPDPEGYARRNIDPSAFYSMDHTAGFWVVDAKGRLRLRFAHDVTSTALGEGVRTLLKERS
jgi:protein SCO1